MSSSLTLAATNDNSGGNSAFSLIFFLLIGLVMYFMLIRPQKRRMREAQQLTQSIGEGDEIITTGGVYGFVSAVEGDVLWLDIADEVVIRVHRSAVAKKVTAASAAFPAEDTVVEDTVVEDTVVEDTVVEDATTGEDDEPPAAER